MTEFRDLLEGANSHPFLFIGSGFSLRYLDAEDWKGLVSHFAHEANPGAEFPFELYRNRLAGSSFPDDELLPRITEVLEPDYNARFLSAPEFAEARVRHRDQVLGGISALKIGVSDHFLSREDRHGSPRFSHEIEALRLCQKNVAGIITTNFDRFIESVFPGLHPYVGQDELLFNQSFAVGELYKIHGCASQPDSLVLTQKDYAQFRKKNAFLSAKLLTIFLEHPIIFLGYSLTDSNIRSILSDIVECLNDEQLNRLSTRIFFVQRKKPDRTLGVSTVIESFNGRTIQFRQVVVQDFSAVYHTIASLRTTYSPQILRRLKKDVYELVASSTPKERIRVVDMDDATNLDKVEIVIGVGIAGRLSSLGYERLEFGHLCEDLLTGQGQYDPEAIVQKTLPKLGRSTSYNLPVFKYLSEAPSAHLDPGLAEFVQAVEKKGIDYFRSTSLRKRPDLGLRSIADIRKRFDLNDLKEASKALVEVVRLSEAQLDSDQFLSLLKELTTRFDPVLKAKAPFPSDYRRAVRVYDWVRYGQKKAPAVPTPREAN